MNRLRTLQAVWLLCVFFFVPTASLAQEKCPAPTAFMASSAPNIFSAQQEVDLGDVLAEKVERSSKIIHDDALAAHMNSLLGRILVQIPSTGLRFQVTLLDDPSVDAFSLPGGRIYVTRKMVAFIRNDDDLAGLLAHEMGHILSHQSAIEITRQLHDILGVTSVGDRKDIFDKFNRLIDNYARDPKLLEQQAKQEEPEQYQADHVGLYAIANAGYAPQSFADFFDRLARTRGKTGGWMSDLFGVTTPDQKRLRVIYKDIDGMPAACRTAPVGTATDEFLRWQSDVIAYSGLGRKEMLAGLLAKKTLDPPLRNDVTNLAFSPDGRYVLAQDDASVFVLSRDPLRLLFRADAPDSHAAQFSPDSQSIVFDTRGMRIEKWNISNAERESAHEIATPGGCNQTWLSPDGNTLACINDAFDLLLYDVSKGEVIFTKKHAFEPNDSDRFAYLRQFLFSLGGEFQWVHMGFSPDGKTLLAANLSGSVAVDVASRTAVALHGALPELARGGFCFLTPDRVIAINSRDEKNSAILKFPSGEVESRLPLGGERWRGTSHGDYVVVGPLKDFPTGVLDLKLRRFVFGVKDTYAVDAYEGTGVYQARDGEIVFFDLDNRKNGAHTPISLSPLGTLRAEAVSPDLKWVAISGETRGAVWDMTSAKRMYYTRSFHGAYFDGDTSLLADFPKFEPQARSIARFDLRANSIDTGAPVDDQSSVRQHGQFLVAEKASGKSGAQTIEVRDVRDAKLLWTRAFPKGVPMMTFDPRAASVLLGWRVDEDAAKEELKSNPALQARLAAIRDRKNPYLLQALDARTGTKTGEFIVDTGKGSFRIAQAYAIGDWAVVVDSEGRTLLFSVSTGEQKGTFFGTRSLLSPAAGILGIESEPGRVDVYAMPSFEKRGQLVFSSPVALWAFSEDGKQLLILTKDQTAYTFDSSRIASGDTTAAASAISLQR